MIDFLCANDVGKVMMEKLDKDYVKESCGVERLT